NDAPTITSVAQTGTVTETADDLSGTDAEPADATGTITFADVDITDEHTASITATVAKDIDGNVTANPVGTLTLDPVNNTADSIAWTFDVDNSEIDYLAAGESLTQVYTVEVDDGNNGTVTQDVTITIDGTNDAPTITSVAQTGTVTETADDLSGTDAEPADATGTITFADVDITDEH
ncbi:MAG: hypothetical protein GY814_07525, partial [Gammaproteobacteria bacterium]|nr:hypothetical protein [Gammaproteobacteria bacterium]